MSTLFHIFDSIQNTLFPWLEQALDPLSEKEQKIVQMLSLMDLQTHMKAYRWKGKGRKRKNRVKMAKAFVAKAIYNFETTDILMDYLRGCKNLRRLCGWENPWQVPSKSTFSRAFAQFSEGNLTQDIHEAMVIEHCGEKLAGHISRDSTAIAAREKPVKKKSDQSVTQPKRIAIPLSQMSQNRITNLYDLMDSAYDAPQIHSFSKKIGHQPIIDHNPRRGEKIYMDPATKARFAERSSAERVNSNLKDN